jgi:hypothetical protein
MLRFFACEEDLSHEPPDVPLPDAVASEDGVFWIVGTIAGGQAGWYGGNRNCGKVAEKVAIATSPFSARPRALET